MTKRLLYLLVGSLTLIAGTLRAQQQQWPDENARKLSIALYAIENLYVDEPNKKKLVEDAIRGMLDKLDRLLRRRGDERPQRAAPRRV